MRLSEYSNEEALDLLAELIEPASAIFSDVHIRKMIEDGNFDTLKMCKMILKRHKKPVIEILAVLDGVPVREYKCNVFTLPIKLLEIFNDEELVSFFITQAKGATSFMPATGNIGEKEI